jgi:methyl-accepting chemotaxis protein
LRLKPTLIAVENRNLCDNIIYSSHEYIKYFDILSVKRIAQYNNGIEKENKEIANILKPMVQIGLHLEEQLSAINKSAIKLKKNSVSTLNTILFTIAIISMILFISLSLILSNQIIKSLNDFQQGLLNFFKYLSKEITTVELLVNTNQDEFGAMSKIVNVNISKILIDIENDIKFIEDTQNVMNRVQKGWFSQLIVAETKNPALIQLKSTINHSLLSLKNNFIVMNNTLEEYTNFDYTKKLQLKDIEKNGVFDILILNIDKLRDAITQMLVENKSNGLTLDKSSDILVINVDKLNNNSNAAAASLEQTAAALEEITSNISSNTNNIITMSGYANQLTSSSNQGQELANQTTKAMIDIDNEVNAINEAISVIDQIAFQTNILSLNAAVEAATAGESGKGFAVVAQEVRNLASRSADAANEIKILVENATIKANTGKIISEQMIEGYFSLNDNISKTINLIKDVEHASKEQLQGIEQINDAVNSLDQQTQENAMIASQTHDVALQTDVIAKLIVSTTNEKEFIGKDTVEFKS